MTDHVCAGAEGRDFVGGEIRLKLARQVEVRGGRRVESGKSREEFVGNLLSAKIPQYGAKFIIFVKTDAVIYRVEFARVIFKKDVFVFAIRVVDEQVEQHDGLEELFVVV